MAGLYETLLGQPYAGSIFGNVAVTPSGVSSANARIDALKQNVANAQAALDAANNDFNNYKTNLGAASNRQNNMSYYVGGFPINNKAYREYGRGRIKTNTDTNPMGTSLAQSYATRISDAQKVLSENQQKLDNALARQEAIKLAGEQAVGWGQTARAAEEAGIARAAQMYQQAMQGEATRNAIMNNAINTVGFGGGR